MAEATDEVLRSVLTAARRTAIARGCDPTEADDVAQEAATRVLAAGERLDTSVWVPYAVVVAGNLVVQEARHTATARRLRHRLYVPPADNDPSAISVARERDDAVRQALARLDVRDRDMLERHLEGVGTAALAAETRSTPGAVAARLARLRAKLRVDYVLALRRVALPAPGCRPVLEAISAGDARRQRTVEAALHLKECPVCPALVEPLTERRSGLAGIAVAPLVLLGGLGGRVQSAASNGAVQAVTGVAVAGAVATGVVLANQPDAPARPAAVPAPQTATSSAPAPSPSTPSPALQAPVRLASGTSLLPLLPGQVLEPHLGDPVIVTRAPVQAVVSHPGFWIGPSATQRLYVHIEHPELFSGLIRTGRTVSFVGRLQKNPAGFSGREGVTGGEGGVLLDREGVHITVDARVLQQH